MFYQVLILVVMAVVSPIASVMGAEELSPADKKELFGLVDQFRRARNDLEARAEIVPRALEFGESGASIIKKYLDRELEPLVLSYSKALDSAARAAFARQAKSVDLEKVEKLREQFFAISNKPDLSKADLDRAEPIFRELEQMVISISAEQLFAGVPTLSDKRERIERVADMLRKCEDKLPDESSLPADLNQWLLDVEQRAVANARPMNPADRQVAQKNAMLAKGLDKEEVKVVNDLNYMRMILGLSSLVIEPKLAACARDHSTDMDKLDFFSHTSPVSGKTTPWDRAKRFGVETRSENIYVGSTQGSKAHWAWFHSPGHHVNMLSPNRKAIGVGRAGKYFTQMFQ